MELEQETNVVDRYRGRSHLVVCSEYYLLIHWVLVRASEEAEADLANVVMCPTKGLVHGLA